MPTVRQAIASLSLHPTQIKQATYFGISQAETAQCELLGITRYQGKVREMLRRNGRIFMVHTDRLTAFDRYIDMVPYKGLILSELSRFWMTKISQHAPTHFKRSVNRRVLELEACEPVKAEIIVRGYMAGSMMRAYQEGVRTFCGQSLSDGLKPYEALTKPIITPTSKAAAFEHDEETTPNELISSGVCTSEEWEQIEDLALKIFEEGQKVYGESGWILVDTKYEFGRNREGKVCVIDEVHTPDSSRLWTMDSYEDSLSQKKTPQMLDKEIVRRYLMEQGFKGEGNVPSVPQELLLNLASVYLDVAETVMNETLIADEEDTDLLSVLGLLNQ